MNRPTLEDDKNREETKQAWPSRIDPNMMQLDDSLNRPPKESQLPYTRKDSLIGQPQMRKDSLTSQSSTPISTLPEKTDSADLLRKPSVTELREDFENIPMKGNLLFIIFKQTNIR